MCISVSSSGIRRSQFSFNPPDSPGLLRSAPLFGLDSFSGQQSAPAKLHQPINPTMKHILFTALMMTGLLSAASLSAQGNLQFNQVKLVSTSETVPTGKVWKVESVFSTSQLAAYNNGEGSAVTVSLNILINGTSVVVERSSVGIGTQTGSAGVMRAYWGYASAGVTRLPFWLPEGTSLAASTNAMALSVVEFNVIP
jgi:archaellum component FlaF (FlaF/FlaG flagellin family)